ncbi:MAG: imidazole glycerol phosphate synthase subunit HisF [Candidatus Omnitrophota bacterium]
MLAKRIIPCLDIKDGRVVKGVKFIGLKDAGDPVEIAKVYDTEGADELVFLDITATLENRKTLVSLVERIAQNIATPFTLGGGIGDINDLSILLNAGASKVSINSAAVKSPGLIKEAAKEFGSRRIVLAIDAKKSKLGWEVYINGGMVSAGLDALTWAREGEDLGAGEILLTSMDFDGTKSGYDIELTKAISEAVKIPVIASGGAGKLEDFYNCFTRTNASAALAASIFHYREYSILQVKEYLKERGISVRL